VINIEFVRIELGFVQSGSYHGHVHQKEYFFKRWFLDVYIEAGGSLEIDYLLRR